MYCLRASVAFSTLAATFVMMAVASVSACGKPNATSSGQNASIKLLNSQYGRTVPEYANFRANRPIWFPVPAGVSHSTFGQRCDGKARVDAEVRPTYRTVADVHVAVAKN